MAQLIHQGENRRPVHAQSREGIGLEHIHQAQSARACALRRQDQGRRHGRCGLCGRLVQHLHHLLQDALAQVGGEEIGHHHRRDGRLLGQG